MTWYGFLAIAIVVILIANTLLKTHRNLRSHGQNRLVSLYFLIDTRRLISYNSKRRIKFQGRIASKALYYYIKANGWRVTIL